MEAIYNICTYHYYLLCNNHWLSSQRASNNSSLCWPVWWHFSIHPNNLLYVHLIRIVVSLSSSNQHRRHSLVDFVWCDIAVITSEFYHSFLQISQFCRLNIEIKSSWKNPKSSSGSSVARLETSSSGISSWSSWSRSILNTSFRLRRFLFDLNITTLSVSHPMISGLTLTIIDWFYLSLIDLDTNPDHHHPPRSDLASRAVCELCAFC